MTERPLARIIADFAYQIGQEGDLPPAVAQSVGQRVLDTLGICVASYRLETSSSFASWIRDQGGIQQAHGIGLPEKIPAAQAAFLNGVLAHSLDYDDTHLPSVLHPSASVIPAVLAAAETYGASGAATVRAIAVGIEVTVRLGMAGYDSDLGNSIFFEHGQHATSICGAMGSAVGAGMLAGFGPEQLVDVLGLAASMASGIIEGNRNGGTVKRLHCGWAAHSAITATQLVERGFTGPPTVLEGRFGFFRAFLRDEGNLDVVVEGLGNKWCIPDIFFKPYPANHFTHTAVDAGMALRKQGLKPEDVQSVELRVPTAVVRTIGEPLAVKQTPKTGYQAQFSGPFAFVAGLIGGGGLGLGLEDFSDKFAQDPERRRLMSLVNVIADEQCDEIFPNQFPCIVQVVDTSGKIWKQEILTNRGGPQRPLDNTELTIKFRSNAEDRLGIDLADTVRDLSLQLDEQDNVDKLMKNLSFL